MHLVLLVDIVFFASAVSFCISGYKSIHINIYWCIVLQKDTLHVGFGLDKVLLQLITRSNLSY